MRKRKAITSRAIQLALLVLPFLAVVLWVTFIFFNPPVNSRNYRNEEELINASVPKIIKIKARRVNRNNEIEEFEREINLSDTVAYVDMWRSHWCTYYNDREFFFTPRINEMLQRLRQYDVPVVTISSLADDVYSFTKQRKAGKMYTKKGAVDAIEEYHADQTIYHYEYIPLFEDICVYKDLTRYGYTRDNRYTPRILLSTEDIFVQNFRESAEAFVGLGKKTVIVFGQHTNMCLMAVFLYCQQVGLDLIIVRDLVDACWVYELEHSYANSHTKGNNITNMYFDKKHGTSIISYDLIRSLKKLDVPLIKPKYQYFQKSAFQFKYL